MAPGVAHVIATERYTIEGLNRCPAALYVFGDNDTRTGCGGQAVVRYCCNSLGVRVKKSPCRTNDCFYCDSEFADNVAKIDADLRAIEAASALFEEVRWPAGGLGTGLAELPQRAPRTFAYLEGAIKNCFGVDLPAARCGNHQSK